MWGHIDVKARRPSRNLVIELPLLIYPLRIGYLFLTKTGFIWNQAVHRCPEESLADALPQQEDLFP